ncbi:MAG: O-antigen ligase family protein [Actinomycetota bacterium]
MISILLGIAIGLVVAGYLVRTSIKVALVSLLSITLLLPGTVLAPGSFSGHTTLHRIVLGIFVLNILRKIALRQIPASVLRPTRLTVALAAWVVVTFTMGVALADPAISVGFSMYLWIFVVDYAMFFYFVVAAIRAINDPWWFARAIVGLMVVSAGIVVYEHYAAVSVGRWLSELIRGSGYLGVHQLRTRGGEIRARAGFEFALAYAWAATALVPLVIVVATRTRHWMVRFAPALVVLSVAWTYTRSAYVGVAAAGLLLLLTSGFDRRVSGFVLAGVAVVGLAVSVTPILNRTFSSPEGSGSAEIRAERLPLVLSSAAEHPYFGRGLSSTVEQGIRTTDSSFLLVYAEMGVVGLTGITLLILATICFVAPAIRAPPPDRLLGAAAFCGVVLGGASGAFLDVFNVSGSARTFWAVAALGVVVGERAGVRWPVAKGRRLLSRAWIPAVAVAGGFLLIANTAPRAAAVIRFTTRSANVEAVAQGSSEFIGTMLINTACEIFETRVAAAGHTASCYDLQSELGIGDVRIETPDPASLTRVTRAVVTVVNSRLQRPRFYLMDEDYHVRPTWVRTAPVWMGIGGAALAVLVPPLPPVRRRRARERQPTVTPLPV